MADQIRVAVVGATGYGGAEMVRLLANHPNAAVTTVTSSRLAGTALREECPWLATDLVLTEFDPSNLNADVVILAQENGFAMEHAPSILPNSRVIDLSADFRLNDFGVYRTYYQREHLKPKLDTQPIYGLPEWVDKDKISDANLIANPGCYPTAILMALMPLAINNLISGIPVIDAKSGVSGAGRSRKETEYLFTELDGGFRAYGVVGHRHTPEIEQLASQTVRFTPHLLPLARGIHATCHVPVHNGDNLRELFADSYATAPFVQLVSKAPSTKQVLGTNRCDLYVDYDPRTGHAIILSVIDNLVKGMAGQAIQNLNLMFGLPETSGLPVNGVWP